MRNELRGCVPKLPFSYTGTIINRAWDTVRKRNLWSFQLFDGQWIAPGQYSGISAVTNQGSNLVTISAQDIANLTSLLPTQIYSLITQRQFRIASGGLYNIRAYNSLTGVMTLDRPYGEQTTSGSSFQIYQAYYIPTVSTTTYLNGVPTVTTNVIKDFKMWLSVRDMANFRSLYTNRYTRQSLDKRDPQRTWYGIPTDVVPFDNDALTGALMFELWGAPTFNVNYQLYGIRNGADLVNNTDTLPYAIREDTVLSLARVYAYEWAEANKTLAPRNVGPDFKYLMGEANALYKTLLGEDRRDDRERVDNWFTMYRLDDGTSLWPFYNSLGSSPTANPGGYS